MCIVFCLLFSAVPGFLYVTILLFAASLIGIDGDAFAAICFGTNANGWISI